MKSPTPIRLLLVDDHFIIRMGLAGSLNQEDDIEVIAEAAIKTALSHRQSAESMDPTHTDAAWALDNVKSGALIEFYETYLNGA